MTELQRVFRLLIPSCVCVVLAGVIHLGPARALAADAKRPSLSVKATPMVAFAPAKIVLSGELKGGANDDEKFYCPSLEWDWGDETVSESKNDCAPYQAGKSEIKRRFTIDRVFRTEGTYNITLRLKKKDKAIASASVTVQVRQGLHDPDR